MIALPIRPEAGRASDTTISLSSDVKFDDRSRLSSSEQPMPAGGVLKAIREAADMSGVDAVAELYNEALKFATDGHLRQARDRVNVLVGMVPNDGDARLLLAKLHVAGQRWQDALGALDEAQGCGAHVPMELRRAVEEHLRADRAADEEADAANRAREQGEVKALRQEARRLRSENAQFLGRAHDLERETRKWAWTTAAVSALGLMFIGVNLLISGGSSTVATPTVAEVAASGDATAAAAVSPDGAAQMSSAAVAGATGSAAAAPATASAIADLARGALGSADGLDDTELKVVVRGNQATVTGTVLTAKQKVRAKQVLTGVNGISSVDNDGVTVLARTKGTEHVVGKGDTLSRIAVVYYGDGSLAGRIQKANTATLKGGANLSIGQKLKIPPVQ